MFGRTSNENCYKSKKKKHNAYKMFAQINVKCLESMHENGYSLKDEGEEY